MRATLRSEILVIPGWVRSPCGTGRRRALHRRFEAPEPGFDAALLGWSRFVRAPRPGPLRASVTFRLASSCQAVNSSPTL